MSSCATQEITYWSGSLTRPQYSLAPKACNPPPRVPTPCVQALAAASALHADHGFGRPRANSWGAILRRSDYVWLDVLWDDPSSEARTVSERKSAHSHVRRDAGSGAVTPVARTAP